MLSLFAQPCFADAPPAESLQYRRELSTQARRVFGPDAPIAALAGQIHQESGWRPGLTSRTGAVGLAQFMPATADGLEDRYNDLEYLSRASPRWAFRAQALLMRDLRDQVDHYRDACQQWAWALQGYVGGMKWVRRRQAASDRPEVCLYASCRINPGILASNQKEAQDYPERILDLHAPRYLTWGGSPCSR